MSDLETAFHEAGHKVAAYRLGFNIGECNIISDEENGRAGVSVDEEPWSDGSRDEDHAIVLYAGLQAQKRHNPNADPAGSCGDNEKAEHYVRLHGFSEAELRERADELLEKHWAEVEALATLLMEEKRVGGEDAGFICDAIEEGLDWREELADFRRRRPDRPSQS